MIRLLVDDREDKIKNNISFEPYKRPIKNFKGNGFKGNGFDIKFLGIDEDGYEIYQGNKDSWKNFINYLFDVYKKYFTIVEDDIVKIERNEMNGMKKDNKKMNEIKTVTVDVKDYETIKKKAEAFDKLIKIACHDGVEFYQEWNKQDVRKACKGGSVKVGEVIGKWHGEIKFTGDDGQSDFGEFVKTMIEGMDEGQLRRLLESKG